MVLNIFTADEWFNLENVIIVGTVKIKKTSLGRATSARPHSAISTRMVAENLLMLHNSPINCSGKNTIQPMHLKGNHQIYSIIISIKEQAHPLIHHHSLRSYKTLHLHRGKNKGYSYRPIPLLSPIVKLTRETLRPSSDDHAPFRSTSSTASENVGVSWQSEKTGTIEGYIENRVLNYHQSERILLLAHLRYG